MESTEAREPLLPNDAGMELRLQVFEHVMLLLDAMPMQ